MSITNRIVTMNFAQLKYICERNWRNFKYVKVYICDDFFPRVIIFIGLSDYARKDRTIVNARKFTKEGSFSAVVKLRCCKRRGRRVRDRRSQS